MKRLYLSAGLIVLMAAACAVHIWSISTFTGQLTALLGQAQEQVEQENWGEAARLTHLVKDQWQAREGYLYVTLRHTDIDAVLLSMDETLAFLEGDEQQPAEYAAVNARLIGQLELLAEAEKPTLTNLF